MVEVILKIGDEKAEPLETALLINSLNGLLQSVFFIIIAISVAKYIKNRNANSKNNKHS